MKAIDDLRLGVIEKNFGIEDIVEGIATVLKKFGFKREDGSVGFYEPHDLSNLHPYFEYMRKMGLIHVAKGGRIPITTGKDKNTGRSVIMYAYATGEITFTEKAHDLYKRLEEEDYYISE